MTSSLLPSLWNDTEAKNFDEKDLLVYRRKLLERHSSSKNFVDPSTSAKLIVLEPLMGLSVETLWVKNSNKEFGISNLSDFATVYLNKLEMLRSQYKTMDQED